MPTVQPFVFAARGPLPGGGTRKPCARLTHGETAALTSPLLFLHGLVHIVGFIGPFQLIRRVPYQISVLGENLDAGDLGAKLLGVLRLLTAVSFAIAAAAEDWWST